MSHELKVGDRVKKSAYALSGARDHWLASGGGAKEQAKAWYDQAKALRGVVTELLHGKSFISSDGYEVKWSDGSVSRCMTSVVVKAED